MALLPSWVTPRHIKYGTIAVIGLLHVAALAAPFTFSWTGLILCLILFWVTGGLGITLCYHRLLTHRSYRTPKFVEYILTFFGCLALQGGPITWVATHRVHHKESDEEPDPHTPVVENFLWAHLLWNFFDDPKLDSFDKCKRFAKDLARDPVQRFFNKTFFLIYLAGAGGVVHHRPRHRGLGTGTFPRGMGCRGADGTRMAFDMARKFRHAPLGLFELQDYR